MPEVGRSWQPLRESGGSFIELWSLFRQSVRNGRDRTSGERPKLDTMGFWLLVVGVLCVVYAGWVLAVELLALLVPAAQAQVLDGSMFEGSDPKTRELLDFLYEMGTGGGSALGEMMRYFNLAVFGVVGVLLIYQVLFGVVETGRTGQTKVDGWQVLRAVLAVALIFPLPASGLGPGQHLLLGLLDVSGSAAAGVWSRFSEVVVSGGAPAPVSVPASHREVAKKMILTHTCMYVHNQVAANAGDGAYIAVERFDILDPDEPGRIRAVKYRYKDPNWFSRHRGCGSIEISTAPATDNEGARMMAQAHFNAVRSAAFVAAVDQAAKELGDLAISTSDTFGGSLPHVDDWLDASGVLESYSNEVVGTLGAATTAASESLSEEVRRAIESEGWLAAASFFLVIARQQGAFLDAVAAVPEVARLEDPIGGLLWPVVEPWDEVGPKVEAWLSTSAESVRVTPGRSEGLMTRLFDLLPSPDSVAHLRDGNPLESLISWGYTLRNIGLTILGAEAAAGFLPGVGRLASLGVGAALGGLGPILKVIGGLFLAAGIALAHLLPLIPFLRFYFGVITWVLAVVEAMAAIPLFLAIHVNGQGSGIVNRASHQGYLLVLHAVIRPALMVLGLVFGYLIFIGGIRLFNWLYAAQLEAMENATRLGLLTFVISWLIYTAIAYAVVNASFKAIDVVPNEVMRWLGGQGRGGGDESSAGLVPVRGMFSRMGGLSAVGGRRGGGQIGRGR